MNDEDVIKRFENEFVAEPTAAFLNRCKILRLIFPISTLDWFKKKKKGEEIWKRLSLWPAEWSLESVKV